MAPSVSPLYGSFALYPSGVTLVTVRDGDDHQFFVAASVLTASVEPFALAVSVARHRIGADAMIAGKTWALSILATRHLPLVRSITGLTPRTDRLRALFTAGAEESPEGPLWLPDALVTFWCTTLSVTPVNDQLLIAGGVLRGSPHRDGDPLLRWQHSFRGIGDAQ
ncbi:MAG: flavin reductase family protein [Propioniciclava sp.]|uniref:flavin reductase family protein n=1 Tax=Propioniciclava sp. TaxID=2038686 RepID=UPI0039E4D835